MKTVFSSNSQVCHVWAQQNQSNGKGNNIFFEGTKIYSYGYHYCIAQIHIYKGKKFALINSKGYSISTAKHTGEVRNALNGLMPVFDSPEISSITKAIKYSDTHVKDYLGSMLKKQKVSSIFIMNYYIDELQKTFRIANELRTFFNKPAIKLPIKELNKVKKHLNSQFERYKELNTPENVIKRENDKQNKLIKEQAKFIEKFYNGEIVYHSLYKLSYELLRVKNDIIQTSRGAEVPFKEGLMLYMALKNNRDVLGKTVGNFTVVNVQNLDNDKSVKIGCHSILMSEAAKIFENIQLVK